MPISRPDIERRRLMDAEFKRAEWQRAHDERKGVIRQFKTTRRSPSLSATKLLTNARSAKDSASANRRP